MINSTNLLSLKLQQVNKSQPQTQVNTNVSVPDNSSKSGLISAYLDNLAMINTPAVKKAENTAPVDYHNDLKTLFQHNEAKILAIVPRTFNAKDTKY